MAMVAIGRDHVIVFTHHRNRGYSHRFLADVKVKKATHEALIVVLEGCLFESPDAEHFTQKVDFLRWFEGRIDGCPRIIHRADFCFEFGFRHAW